MDKDDENKKKRNYFIILALILLALIFYFKTRKTNLNNISFKSALKKSKLKKITSNLLKK